MNPTRKKREPIGVVTVYSEGGMVHATLKIFDQRLTGRVNLSRALRFAAQKLHDDALTGEDTARWPEHRPKRRRTCRCLAGRGKRMRPDTYRGGKNRNQLRCARCKLPRRQGRP